MTTVTSSSSSSKSGTTSGSSSSTSGTTSADSADRFLKLLVAQMKNQDPLNPMDNAQVTSQMAQINTVNGIEKLNTSLSSMSTNMLQSQILQGASLVGHSVLTTGNSLKVDSSGSAQAAFELTSAATSVQVNVLDSGGSVIDTMDLGAQDSGLHGFSWKPDSGVSTTGVTFSVTAKHGSTKLSATSYTKDQVDAVSTGSDNTLTLQLHNSGAMAYNKVRAISS
ncbi:flagellar hook assembly protein FlgD [Aquabacterium sp.]|uniref:flagellar hook assembly protein FlgD n=1 Tax=Aquabacterium sp. TaxID=1872578 RepID=UPI0035B4AAAD